MKVISRFVGVVVVVAMAATGCARVSPVEPSASSAAPPVVEIGTDGTATIDLVAAVYEAALEASGLPAAVVEVVPGTETLAVADNSPVAMPVFARTLLEQYDREPVASAADVVSDLATAVAPDLAVLETSKVDGSLVWAVTMQSASAGVGDLVAVGGWGPDKVVAAPEFALTSAAGVPALQVAYGSKATFTQVDAPAARRQALVDGSAQAAAFRRTETAALEDLVELDDPMEMAAHDPLVVLLAADLAEQRPEVVLVLDAVQQALTTESVADLTHAAAGSGRSAAIAQWLSAEGLAS